METQNRQRIVLADLPTGQRFYVKNGDWRGQIVENDVLEKCVFVEELQEVKPVGYFKDLDVSLIYDKNARTYSGVEHVVTLPSRQQEVLKEAISDALKEEFGEKELSPKTLDILDNAMSGRLCDLEDSVDWRAVLSGRSWRRNDQAVQDTEENERQD